jgi:hypothetical protein
MRGAPGCRPVSARARRPRAQISLSGSTKQLFKGVRSAPARSGAGRGPCIGEMGENLPIVLIDR